MKHLVIVGRPLGHTLSPIMHTSALCAMGLANDYDYRALPMNWDELPALVHAIKSESLAGANVTIPYKAEILSHLSTVRMESKVTGAVNTIFQEDNDTIGCNTDIFGFAESLRVHRVNIDGFHASILGSGGAARAVAYVLAKGGIAGLEILSRNLQSANELARMFESLCGIRPHIRMSSAKRSRRLETDLVVNCTPVGMANHSVSEIPLDSSLLIEDMLVVDLVYNPLKTRLMLQAERAGCKTVGGLEMLVHQGAASLELWTGKKAPVGVMRQAVLEALGGVPSE